jgi:ATP-binding cassette, subfamily B, putative efflux pump
VILGNMTVGELVAVNLYLTPLYTPLQRFSELNVIFANSMAALERVFEILDMPPDIRDSEDAVELDEAVGKIKFDGVCFAYSASPGLGNGVDKEKTGNKKEFHENGYQPNSNGKEPEPQQDQGQNEQQAELVLSDLSFVVQPGEKIALVGPSGSGKSTLVSLLPRFYDVASGSIHVDEYDVRQVKVESLRRNIGMVLQDPILFSGTIRDNLRYGRPNASDEEIVEASKAANAYDFIMNLPDGFESEVGENGQFLSGGQRQRLTIARAFLKDPKILILDEATSALDAESERLVQNALKRLMKNRTTFIIAHRLSTITDVDRILVLDGGTLVEAGSHAELLAQNGLYRELYSTFEAATLGNMKKAA